MGHIAEDGKMVRAEFSRNFSDSLRIIGDDDDMCAFSSVSLGTIVADAAGTAGQKNNFVFKKTHSWQKIDLLRVRPDFSFGRGVRQRRLAGVGFLPPPLGFRISSHPRHIGVKLVPVYSR